MDNLPAAPTAFTFASIEAQYRHALSEGYAIVTCEEYVRLKATGLPTRTIVNRVDVDVSVKRAAKLGEVFDRLGIHGTFFFRLHANEYNPFSFEHYRIIKRLIAAGHEIGYHSEVIDQAALWQESPEVCLRRDIEVFNRAFGIQMSGVASHGGLTGLNNLDFWATRTPAEFGLLYEAYDREPAFNLFHESFYVSDSEWTRWKCYDRGQLVSGDRRTFGEHVATGHALIYLLIHADTYFDHHFYE